MPIYGLTIGDYALILIKKITISNCCNANKAKKKLLIKFRKINK